MLIDIGAKSTDLIYSEQGRFFTRSISAGGIFVTSAIAREFNVPFMEAERLKTTSGLVSMSNGQTEGLDPATANLATVIRTAMTRLASEIQRTTNHYRAQMNGSAPVKAYLCGGGASLPYTKEFLEDKLGIPISFFNPMHNVGVGSGVDVNTISREAFILGGLIGTAVNAIGRASLNIDLEPTAIAKKRANQKKMPAIIAGAAIAVLGAAAYAVTGYMGVQKAEETLAGVHPTVTSIKSEQSALRQKEQELKNWTPPWPPTNSSHYSATDMRTSSSTCWNSRNTRIIPTGSRTSNRWPTSIRRIPPRSQATPLSRIPSRRIKTRPWWTTSGWNPPRTPPVKMNRPFTALTPCA